MPELALASGFWIGLGQIILINIILSGDNAVVIALAARSLPEAQRRQAILWGSFAAIALRVVLTLVAAELLRQPYLKLAGSGLLFWIAVQLLLPEDGDGGADSIRGHAHLLGAIRTILIADVVMSLDNVLAVAAAAHDDFILLVLGLAISIPLVIFGSTLVLKLMDRFPWFVTVGAALLGFVAGEMLVSEPALATWPGLAEGQPLHRLIPLFAAIGVVAIGRQQARQSARAHPSRIVDLAPTAEPSDSPSHRSR